METNSITLSGTAAQRIIGLKTSALDDYLSARILYNHNLLIQATVLANTAIEKELKAYIEVRGKKVTIGHETFKIFNLLRTVNKDLADKLNSEYFEVLQKLYRVRYPEQQPPGYNFTISKRKFLAELDYTYSILESSTQIQPSSQLKNNINEYNTYINQKDPRLYDNNYLLNNIAKDSFIEGMDYVIDFRILKNNSAVKILYTSDAVVNDGRFKIEGFVPIDDRSFILAQWNKNSTLVSQ